MTKVLERIEISLRSFYVFNSSFSSKEGDEYKKVLYYYPNDIELNTKIKDIGLSEAIITFTGTFTSEDDACKAVHTQKTTQIFYQPEPGYWMVLVCNVPKEIRTKDGVEVAEYRGGEVHDRVYRAVLEQCYNMFRLFAGTFQMNYEQAAPTNNTDAAREHLQDQLSLFYNKYLISLKLANYDAMDVMRSIQYLPLNKFLFLRAHNFVNMICATFPTISETIFLYNEQVVCSGKMSPNDLFGLHEYIAGTLLPAQTELGSTPLLRSNSTASESYRNGVFITGPTAENKQNDDSKPPKVYLKNEQTNSLQAFYLIVYRALNATLCLFVNATTEPQNEFYTELHSYMGPQLSSIARDIGDALAKQLQSSVKQAQLTAALSTVPTIIDPESNVVPKYIFVNEKSLKHLTNISMDKRRPKTAQTIPPSVMNLIADLGNDIAEYGNNNTALNTSSSDTAFEEMQVKTTTDFWIIKRRCNWRQYFVIIFNSKATLLDVTQEAKRIFEQELTDDVFFDK